MLRQHRHGRRRVERWLAGQHAVERRPQAVDVCPGVDPLAPNLLGSHVIGRAEDLTAGADPGAVRPFSQLREPEIQHLDVLCAVAAVDHHQVLRLEIAMHDARVVRLGQARTNLDEQPGRAREGPRPVSAQQRCQVVPLDVFHHQVERVVALPEVEGLDDIGMIELADGLRLQAEPAQHLRFCGGIGRQHLHRRGLPEVKVLDSIDDPHASGPDALADTVAVVDDPAEPGIRGGERRGHRGERRPALPTEPQIRSDRGRTVGTYTQAALQTSAACFLSP